MAESRPVGLLGLPEPIFGLIFEHLSSDQRSAHSFYNSCRAIRDAPSVNQRIHCYKLSISPSQARRELDFSGWPRRAGVKEVKVDLDEQHDGGEVVHPPVFTCAAEQRCKGVETLELNGFSFDAEYGGMAANSLVRQFPAIKNLKLFAQDFRGLDLQRLEPWAAQLERLELGDYDQAFDGWPHVNTMVRGLPMFSNLQNLRLYVSYPDPGQAAEPLDLSPLAALSQLEFLEVCLDIADRQSCLLLQGVHEMAAGCTQLHYLLLSNWRVATASSTTNRHASAAPAALPALKQACVWPSLGHLCLRFFAPRDASLILDASFPSLKSHAICLTSGPAAAAAAPAAAPPQPVPPAGMANAGGAGGPPGFAAFLAAFNAAANAAAAAEGGGGGGAAAGAAAGQQQQEQEAAVEQEEAWDLASVRAVCTRLAGITSVEASGCNLNLHAWDGQAFPLTDGLLAALQPLGPKLTGMVLKGVSLQAGDVRRLASVVPGLDHLGMVWASNIDGDDNGGDDGRLATPRGLPLEALLALAGLSILVLPDSVHPGDLMALCMQAHYASRPLEIALDAHGDKRVGELRAMWEANRPHLLQATASAGISSGDSSSAAEPGARAASPGHPRVEICRSRAEHALNW